MALPGPHTSRGGSEPPLPTAASSTTHRFVSSPARPRRLRSASRSLAPTPRASSRHEGLRLRPTWRTAPRRRPLRSEGLPTGTHPATRPALKVPSLQNPPLATQGKPTAPRSEPGRGGARRSGGWSHLAPWSPGSRWPARPSSPGHRNSLWQRRSHLGEERDGQLPVGWGGPAALARAALPWPRHTPSRLPLTPLPPPPEGSLAPPTRSGGRAWSWRRVTLLRHRHGQGGGRGAWAQVARLLLGLGKPRATKGTAVTSLRPRCALQQGEQLPAEPGVFCTEPGERPAGWALAAALWRRFSTRRARESRAPAGCRVCCGGQGPFLTAPRGRRPGQGQAWGARRGGRDGAAGPAGLWGGPGSHAPHAQPLQSPGGPRRGGQAQKAGAGRPGLGQDTVHLETRLRHSRAVPGAEKSPQRMALEKGRRRPPEPPWPFRARTWRGTKPASSGRGELGAARAALQGVARGSASRQPHLLAANRRALPQPPPPGHRQGGRCPGAGRRCHALCPGQPREQEKQKLTAPASPCNLCLTDTHGRDPLGRGPGPVLTAKGKGTRGQCPRTWRAASLSPPPPPPPLWPQAALRLAGSLPQPRSSPSALCELPQLPAGDTPRPVPEASEAPSASLKPDPLAFGQPPQLPTFRDRLQATPPQASRDPRPRDQRPDLAPPTHPPPPPGPSLTCQGLLVVLPHGDEVPKAGVELLHDGLGGADSVSVAWADRGDWMRGPHLPHPPGPQPGFLSLSGALECPWANRLLAPVRGGPDRDQHPRRCALRPAGAGVCGAVRSCGGAGVRGRQGAGLSQPREALLPAAHGCSAAPHPAGFPQHGSSPARLRLAPTAGRGLGAGNAPPGSRPVCRRPGISEPASALLKPKKLDFHSKAK